MGILGSPKGRYIIVGAGYGGLSTALELSRKGFEVEMFEAAKVLTTQGDVIHISPNASKLFKKWGGTYEKCQKQAANMPFANYHDWKGNKLIDTPLPTIVGNDSEMYVNRGLVQKVLVEEVQLAGVKLHLNSRILEYFEDETSAGILWNSEKISADGVIVADGIKGVGREFVTGSPDKPVSSGYAVYRAWFNLDILANESLTKQYAKALDDLFIVWIGPDVHAMLVTNVALRGAAFFVTHKDEHEAGESWSNPGKIEDVLDVLAGWDEKLLAIVKQLPSDALIDWKLLWRDPVKPWVSPKGRVVLIGDAAHPHLPTSGSGACMALEDSACLSTLLDQLGKEQTATAFRAFELMRYERTSLTQRLGWETRHRWHQTDWDAVKTDPESIKMPQPKWLTHHDPESYTLEHLAAAVENIKSGTPFQSKNVPPGYDHQDWTVESMMAMESDRQKDKFWIRADE